MSRPYNLNGGRPPKLSTEQICYVKNNIKKSLRTLAKELGVSHSCIYDSLNRKSRIKNKL